MSGAHADRARPADTADPAEDRAALAAVYRRIDRRILPWLIGGYMLAYVDRVNISFAKLQMQQELGLSEAAYGLAAGIFFLGYVLFEVPSNMLMARIGARLTLSRIMIMWGLTSASMLFVGSTTQLYVLRFMLGVFEAGFAPGMLYYLTLWYGRERRARVTSYVLLATPLAGIFGGPLATWIMTTCDGRAGLSGWQWLFLLEGLPCVPLGVAMFLNLADSPAKARWLSDRERRLISRQVSSTDGVGHHGFGAMLRDPRIYGLAFSYFCMISGLAVMSYWLPTLMRANGVTDTVTIGLYSALPYVASATAMIVVARLSDRTGHRRLISFAGCLGAAAMLAIAALSLGNLYFCLGALILATAAGQSGYTVFWAIPGDYLKGNAAAGGIAVINSIGLLGGFFSPTVIGGLHALTGSLKPGLLVLAACFAAGGVALAVNRLPSQR